MKTLATSAVIAAAAALALVPIPPQTMERYSQTFYPWIQTVLTGLSNLAPFALFDVLLVGVLVWWLWRLGFDVATRRRGGWLRVTGRMVVRTAACAALMYIVFLVTWGFNYRREPITARLAGQPDRISKDAARLLAERTVSELNALHADAHANGTGGLSAVDGSLVHAFQETQTLLGISGARPSRPKRSLLDWYFRSAGVPAMTDPYFLETLVASDVLPFERPFVVAHEWSHLAGFANEGEANFVGWLTCMHGDAAVRYSGWIFLYGEVIPGLPRAERPAIVQALGAGPRADLEAISARLRRNLKPAVSKAGWRVYDSYLKANRVEAGTASYAEVVRLILQTQFDPEWRPALKTPASP
ncbi:MAG TPA: DUF3810 domain-containing protein [Vicinamibacterales bacterium]|jgi:hypothetical protein|nr:DUF3810 domain-containing protein [Vicinamibacterales bacterium]